MRISDWSSDVCSSDLNRVGLLVETHSWKEYPVRVKITRDTVVALLAQTAAHGGDWLDDAHAADERAAQLGGKPVPLSWKATGKVRTVDFLGYAYTRTPSEVSGALMTRYDETTPQLWQLPLRHELVPPPSHSAPRGRSLLPPPPPASGRG